MGTERDRTGLADSVRDGEMVPLFAVIANPVSSEVSSLCPFVLFLCVLVSIQIHHRVSTVARARSGIPDVSVSARTQPASPYGIRPWESAQLAARFRNLPS